jgi:hypothetical protein
MEVNGLKRHLNFKMPWTSGLPPRVLEPLKAYCSKKLDPKFKVRNAVLESSNTRSKNVFADTSKDTSFPILLIHCKAAASLRRFFCGIATANNSSASVLGRCDERLDTNSMLQNYNSLRKADIEKHTNVAKTRNNHGVSLLHNMISFFLFSF